MSPELLKAGEVIATIVDSESGAGDRARSFLIAFMELSTEELEWEKINFEKFKAQALGIKLMK